MSFHIEVSRCQVLDMNFLGIAAGPVEVSTRWAAAREILASFGFADTSESCLTASWKLIEDMVDGDTEERKEQERREDRDYEWDDWGGDGVERVMGMARGVDESLNS